MRSHKFYHPGHTSWTSEIDISVSKLLGFETFANFLRVSVSENLVTGKKSLSFGFVKFGLEKKSLGFGYRKFGLRKKVSVSENLVSEKSFGFGNLVSEKKKIK